MREKKRLFYTDHHEIVLPAGHRFPMAKYRMLRERLTATECGRFELVAAPLASAEVIEGAHDGDYVRHFLTGTLAAGAMRRIGFPWSQAMVGRTLASVGATLCATEEAMRTGWSGSLAGGTHHAFRAEGSGFCVFNDIAVTICDLLARGVVERAAVVDCDVHQGDGTAEIFAGEGRVFTLSIHARTNFPFSKKESRLDVELADGTGDEAYLRALDEALSQGICVRSGVCGLSVGGGWVGG